MATINTYKAQNGQSTYRVRIQRKGLPTQTATFPSLAAAKRWARMIEGQIAEGRYFPAKKPTLTLADVLVKYTADILPRKSPQTQREEGYLLRYWREQLGHKIITEITPLDIRRHRDVIAQKNKPATVLKYLGILSHVFTTAIKEYQVLDINPMSSVSKPPQPRGRVRYLNDQERSRLLEACRKSPNKHLYPLVITALYTGLRRGSLLSLTPAMVDCERGTVSLDKMKNGSQHIVPLVGEALTLIRQRCEELQAQPHAYLFPHTATIPWNAYRNSWQRAVKNAELDNFSFHCLRHDMASMLVQAGVPLYTTGVILNHLNPGRITARYAHLSTDHLRDALEILSQRLSL
jgi:integrase